MNYSCLFKNVIIISLLLNTYFCKEIKNIKYIETEIYSKYPNKVEDNYFYENCTSNLIFTQIKLGSEKQIMEMKLELDYYETIIVEKEYVDQKSFSPYETKLSKTFSNTGMYFYGKPHPIHYYLAKDNLIVANGTKSIKLDDFSLAFMDIWHDYDRVAGVIGLSFLKNEQVLKLNREKFSNLNLNFIDQLNNKNIITGYSFTLKYDSTSKYNGNLIIGPDIEEIFPEEIVNLSKYVIKVNESTALRTGEWEIDVNNILAGDSELLNKKLVFVFSTDFIRGTDEYTEFILKNFFNELIEEGKCKKHIFQKWYHNMGIMCQKNIDIKRFPNLIFDLTSSDKANHLILDYEDLFEEIGEYKYFKIILSNTIDGGVNQIWYFGNEFYKNNLVTFNKKRKDITIYSIKNVLKTKMNN